MQTDFQRAGEYRFCCREKHGPINPGFRNKWWYHGVLGDYTTSITRNLDVTWQFKKDHDLPSYVRIFRTSNDYSDAWIKNYTYPNYTPSGNVTPAQIQDWLKHIREDSPFHPIRNGATDWTSSLERISASTIFYSG